MAIHVYERLGGAGLSPVGGRVAVAGVAAGMATAKRRFRLPAAASVYSWYEAGREGVAPHCWLAAQGVQSVVVDPARVRVDRRARRVKTDRVGGEGLVTALIYWHLGARPALRLARVPSREEEGARAVGREIETLTRERTRTTHQSRSPSTGA